MHGGTSGCVRGVGAVVMLASGAARPSRERPLRRRRRRSARWRAPGSSRRSTSAATPRRSPASASTSTSRASRNPANVYDKTLFTSTAVPAGSRVRFAAMDRYDGMVWGATDDALPGAGRRLLPARVVDHRQPGRGQGGRRDRHDRRGLRAGSGCPRSAPSGPWTSGLGDPRAKAESFRYNLATSTAVVPTGMQPRRHLLVHRRPARRRAHRGDRRRRPTLTPPAGRERRFIKGPTEKWTEDAGHRPDGPGAGDRRAPQVGGQVLRRRRPHRAGLPSPATTSWRLSDEFVNAPQIVGNDEQYAATMALLANEVGVPARVVLGAVVPEDGSVTGKDVRPGSSCGPPTVRGGRCRPRHFMSDTPPADQVPETNTPMSGTVVPPPDPIPPPSDAGDQSDADLKERKATARRRPTRTRTASSPGRPVVGRDGGDVRRSPAARRRPAARPPSSASRRGVGTDAAARPSASARFVGAWRELVDHARDLGQPVPLGPTVTRREQSAGIGSGEAGTLARRADSFVFGPSTPEVAAAATYWESVDAERRAMSQEVGRWQRSGPRPASARCGVRRPGRRATPIGSRPPTTRSRPPRPGVSRPGCDGCAGSLIGVLDVRLTKLVRRPNVGCVSWCLAAARNLA